MRQQLIWLAGAGVAWLSGTYFMAALIGLIAGVLSVLAGVIWPQARPIFIDPISRPRPATRRGQLVIAGAIALLGIGFLWVVGMAWPLPGYPLARLFGYYIGGLGLGMALAMMLTERQTREAHNSWLAAMSPQPNSEWKS